MENPENIQHELLVVYQDGSSEIYSFDSKKNQSKHVDYLKSNKIKNKIAKLFSNINM